MSRSLHPLRDRLTLQGAQFRKVHLVATCGLAVTQTQGDWRSKTIVAGGYPLSSSWGTLLESRVITYDVWCLWFTPSCYNVEFLWTGMGIYFVYCWISST